MAKKYIDIMPPYPRKERTYRRESPKKKQERKSRSAFLYLVLGVFLLVIFYTFYKAGNQTITNTGTSTKTNSNDNHFELFNDQGESNLTENSSPVIVKILNGSPGTNNANAVKDILLNKGYEIQKVEDAASAQNQTIIYFRKSGDTLAQKLSSDIKSTLSPDLQESNSLSSGYDLLLVVGAK